MTLLLMKSVRKLIWTWSGSLRRIWVCPCVQESCHSLPFRSVQLMYLIGSVPGTPATLSATSLAPRSCQSIFATGSDIDCEDPRIQVYVVLRMLRTARATPHQEHRPHLTRFTRSSVTFSENPSRAGVLLALAYPAHQPRLFERTQLANDCWSAQVQRFGKFTGA